MSRERAKKLIVAVGLTAVIALGAFLRLHDLGKSAFRADTILLWDLALRKVPPWLVLTQWFETSGALGQMPMPAFVMQLFLHVFGLPVTAFTVRLPFAIFGIVAIPIAFLAGRRVIGSTFGLLLATLLAVNPYHVYYSREAYFYSSTFLGFFLYFWVALRLFEKLWSRGRLSWGDCASLCVALFFAGYSQMTGLLVCAAGFVFFLSLIIWKREAGVSRINLIRLIATYVIVFLPFVFVPWGPREMIAQYASEVTDLGKKAVALTGDTLLSGVADALCQMSWGKTALGPLLMAILFIGGFIWLWQRNRRLFWLFAHFLLFQLALFAVVRRLLRTFAATRYLAGIYPFMLALMGLGFVWICGQIRRIAVGLSASCTDKGDVRAGAWVVASRILQTVVCVVPLAFWAYYSGTVTQLTGKPTPYYELVDWFNTKLPKGSLVLTDRWYEPWNELKTHASTNVFFTFTYPDEPIENFMKVGWRGTAKEFFRRHPNAAYLEVAKNHWSVPWVGPWQWPREHFARHVAITNRAGLKLREWGLASRGHFYSKQTNGLVVEIFYNTLDDVLQKTKAEGRNLLALYGPDWGHRKLWWEIRDPLVWRGRVWRGWRDKATVDIYNLSDRPLDATLTMVGAALGVGKHVAASTGQRWLFPPKPVGPGRSLNMRMTSQFVLQAKEQTFAVPVFEWDVGPITVATGKTTVVLSDSTWSWTGIPLLVGDMKVTQTNVLQIPVQ